MPRTPACVLKSIPARVERAVTRRPRPPCGTARQCRHCARQIAALVKSKCCAGPTCIAASPAQLTDRSATGSLALAKRFAKSAAPPGISLVRWHCVSRSVRALQATCARLQSPGGRPYLDLTRRRQPSTTGGQRSVCLGRTIDDEDQCRDRIRSYTPQLAEELEPQLEKRNCAAGSRGRLAAGCHCCCTGPCSCRACSRRASPRRASPG